MRRRHQFLCMVGTPGGGQKCVGESPNPILAYIFFVRRSQLACQRKASHSVLTNLLVEPPSPQEFAPLHSQAVGQAPRPLKIKPSHDIYLHFGPQFPDGQTMYRYATDRPSAVLRILYFILAKKRGQIKSKWVVSDRRSFP